MRSLYKSFISTDTRQNKLKTRTEGTTAILLRRMMTLLLIMTVGSMMNMAWGDDIKYHIINNQGKECFRYVIKGNLSYESKATAGFDYKTELCVHPWARSVVATNFRFYINREDAVADANGTLGAYFNEGDVISEVAPGKTEFYVRYSMKSADELAAAGFTYDPDGNMTYLIQIRERNAKGGKRRQVYYDTADGRFEFGNPGEKNKDIPSFESSESFKLQTDLEYRFRVKSGDDPYNTYFYNGAGEGQNANGVLTVSDISRNNDKKAKEKVTYETKIDDYDPETTASLQTFFFVAANEHILQSSWSEQYIGKMFVVGAVGGKEYWMRDVGSENATGGVESYVPYMLVANGSTGTFKDPGFQLQCYQSWRNYDYSNDNTSLALFTPYENTHEVTYHIVNSATHKDAMTIIQRHGPHSPFNLSNRDKLQRIGCTLSTDYYSDRECTTPASGLVSTATDVYIPYTFNSTSTEIDELEAANVVFSTLDNPTWLSLTIRESGTKKLVYDANNNVIQSNTNSTATPDATTLAQQTAQFAFIGDPYSFQVICKAADGKFAYVNPETLAYNNTANNVCFTDSPTDDQDKFAMVKGSNDTSFQIFQRDKFALAFRAFWDARGGGNQIRMYSRTATPEVHGDANLHATLTPTYEYTYNIVDNSGRIAIKYTVTQEVSRRLDGEHGHKAIPSAIYSPYLEGETLTFYTTFTEGTRDNLSNPITVTPASNANIYVSYTNDKLSTRRYLLDGTKSYFMQLGDKYVIYNSGVTTQAGRPIIEGEGSEGKELKIWTLRNSDPYDVEVRNTGEGNHKLLDDTEIHFILMDGAGTAEGQVELLFANGGDLSTPSNSQSLDLNGENVRKYTTTRGTTNQQIIFYEAVLKRTYRLLDKQGKILLEYESQELPNSGENLGVLAKWVSPLVETYHYWARSSFTLSGDTYTLKSGESEITSPTGSTDGYIYVTYDVADGIITPVDPTARIHKNGNATEDFVRDYENSWGQIFMIKFANGDEFYQEKSDALRDEKLKAIYPYANGDSGFNLYGDTKWNEDKAGGSSTRTRWSWYIVSENNDPYHIKITSWQSSHARKLSGDDVNTTFYNYWRTYYNSTIGAVVTATITDDPQVLDDSKTGGSADNTPTEYMLLGTTGSYKLVTTNGITAAGVADHATYGKRRPVKDFLQYWKTYETISRKGVTPEGGTALSYDVFQSQTENPYSFFSAENVTSHPVYKFDAWQNARPITPSDPTKSNSKKYEYTFHYYQKISLDEEFDLIEHSIDGILVLLDKHGWEIMRKPMAKTGDANKASRDAAIRQFDSPMVKTYHFWSTTTKTTGYHKYTNWKDEEGSGSSLADYPEVIGTNGNISDLYVTYDVKPEYTELYSVTATKDGKGNITALTPTVATDKTFLIRQDSKLAYDNSGTLGADDNPANITKIDTGQSLDLGDNYYWYIAPNWDIDKEMGYQYATSAKTDGKEDEDVNNTSDGLHLPRTQLETEIAYYKTSRISFDPYNIQIYNKSASHYLTTNATYSQIDTYSAMAATFPNADPTANTMALDGYHAVNTGVNNGIGHDAVNLHMTNQTYMAVSDANGNMRLMPRFDHYHAIENIAELKLWDVVDQPVDDKAHGQTTLLLRPTIYTYYVIDNQGREALRYTLMSSGSPKVPAIFQSPFAKDFTYYKDLTLTEGVYTEIANGTDISEKQITGSFADAELSGGNVYVRYSYNPDADIDGLLKGTWYHATLNDGSADQDVKVTSSGIVKETFTDDAAHRWRFMDSAGDDRDPYDVKLYNGTVSEGHHVAESDKRYIIMSHFSGTAYDGYALMQAGNASTSVYKFLDGSSTPALTEQTNYTTAGTIDATKKLTLTPVLATNSITYKIITHSGKVALTEENVAVSDESVLKLPEWMETPLMESDAYIFYSAATKTDGKYTVKGYPTTSPKSLDGDVVYVRYDYEKSKKAVESFGMPDFDGLPYNYAPLDLTGEVAYTIGISSNNYGRLWSVNTSTLGISEADVNVNTEMTRVARLWQFTGGDPYEVTIKNPSYSTTEVLAGRVPTDGPAATNAKGEVIKPNTVYPLVKMMNPESPAEAEYTLYTFMVLKYNPKEVTAKIGNVEHSAGALKFYVTSNDHLYMAQSNSLAGGVYIYKDASSYKERLAASGEPMNTVNNTMIIYSSFFYRPVLTYHVITNDGKEALKGYSQMAGTTVEMPQMYQSPLLNSSDFSYYTAATETAGTYTVTESTKMAASTAIADAAAKNAGDIYVRYTYSRANSPFKIATNIDDAAEDGTQLLWDNEEGLDLSGDPSKPNQGGTWYTIANFQSRWKDNEDHGNLFGIPTDYSDSDPKFEKAIVKTLANGRAPSNKRYLWKLMGNDPYAIKIYNADQGKYLSVATSNRKMSLQDKEAANYYQTFMLLEAHANDNEIGDYGRDDEGNYKYQLQRWTSLIATGTQFFTPVTTNTNNKASLSARDTWDFNNYNFSNYAIRMSSSEVVTRQILNMTAGGTTSYCIEFVKAPVTRKYHFHAVNQATGTVTWQAVLEHDWLQPLVLDDNIARQFCKYEKRNTATTGDNVTGTGEFQTRTALEAEGQPNAQFYHDADFTVRVKDDQVSGSSNQYDIYPEIAIESIYDIYFKYQIDNTATVHGLKLGDITSTTEQIANDKAHYAETGRLDPVYYPAYNSGDNHGKWFFMVLDTDDAMSATGDEGSRTYTGNQYFLRREDNGTVNWMNNAYTLHPKAEDNYKDWAPSRVAEWYKKGDNDPYREGRWLWTFVGTDPYNMRIVNMESVVGVNTNAEGVYSLAGADNCWTTVGKDTLSNNAVAYPVTIPTEEPTENQYWGLSYGYGSEQTFSLISTAQTTKIDGRDVNQPLYWNMQSRTINRVTTQSLEAVGRSSDRSNAIQLIPYEPVKYQDINLVIKREDHVKDYTDWKDDQDWSEKTEYEIKTDKADQLKTYDSGISLLYFTAAERTYVAGDKINLGTEFSLPVNVLRAFCKYTLYQDDYQTPYDKDIESTYYYTVTDGPYPTSVQAEDSHGDKIYDEDGKPVYTYVEADGVTPASGAQSIYVKYVVTSDIFLKTAPTKTEVETMAQNNDHVYFMDFPTYDAKGNEITHHAFYDPEATTFMQTGDLSKNKDKNTGNWVPEKKSYSGSAYTSDTSDPYNATQYRTADDRMVTTPEKLKWYFVGDPYKLQVFSTAGEWNGDKQAQLARFNTVETNFKFVSDCVHVRLPDYTHIDNRENLIPTDEYGVSMPDKKFPNRNYNKPYLNDFYWECVPAASSEAGTFALRFKEDNDLLGYRNVYYYLGRDGKTMIYNHSEENPQQYHINLNYRANNERYESGKYLGYHMANNDSTVIRLVQPVKVYITTNRAADSRYDEQTKVTVDEYSGYYGLNETITGVPRHLQRKYVKYNDLTHNGVTSGTHSLTIGNATSSEDCSTHSSDVFVTGTKINPIFKFSVYYNVDDLTADGIHLFSSCETPSAPAPAELTWLDVLTGTNSWLYYDKTNVNGSGAENQTSRVSNYRRAMSNGKTGWNNSADGWTDGLKGLHWAFVGDPYDFTILNRRRYEDATINTEPMWFAAQKETINNYAGANDSIVWKALLVDDITDYTTNTASGTAALDNGDKNAHWSIQMAKTGDENNCFIRTASLDQTAANAAGTNNSDTDNYWRLMAKQRSTDEFFLEPYSLEDHNRYTNNKGNLNWGNYVTNDMRYSQTMNGLGVYEQRLLIRTAVAEDNDKADNDCFDAKVEIRTKDGTLRLSKDKLEIKYGLAPDMLPYTLRRYGCEYTCYINYGSDDPEYPEIQLTRLRDSNTPMDDAESVSTATTEYNALSKAITAAKAAGKNVTLTYVYTVTDEVAEYFTTASDALTEDYTWTNGYFAWDQTYSGTNVEVEYYVDVFDHYVYDANGQIIDAVYIKERRTRVVSNPDQAYPTTAFLNTHTNQVNVFADESTQSKDDRQKWALVGDPYEFTLKNYAQYLINSNATQFIDNNLLTQTTIQVLAQPFAMGIDKDGNTFLSVIDGTSREITSNISFDFSTSSTKTTKKVGSGTNTNDPTGNTYDTDDVKPFKLASLLSYADIVQYHLVIAHQHSLDHTDELTTDQGNTLNEHLLEYLMYQGLQKNDKDMYVSLDGSGNPTGIKTGMDNDIKDLLKKNASLRDFISYPVADYSVARVGIGNHPQVPWYMKRQFCRYFLYQKDVMRSEIDKDSPSIEVADADWGSSTVEIDGVEYKVNPSSPNAVKVVYYNGKFYLYEKASDEIKNAGTTYDGLVQRTFEQDGVVTKAFNIKWITIRDMSYWDKADAAGDGIVQVTSDDVAAWNPDGGTYEGDRKLVVDQYRKKPKYYDEAAALQGKVLDRLQECHYNRMVKIDVVYEVIPEAFQFAWRGRNTTAWYQMMTNNSADGLMNFTYSHGIGARQDRREHYTNNYLWAPEGDPYGFILRSRYATINGNGWDNVAVTTKGALPKKDNYDTYSETAILAENPQAYDAKYTDNTAFNDKRIIHVTTPTHGPSNAVYEMFTGDAGFTNSFLMHPTSAFIDTTDPNFTSYYMIHDTGSNISKLTNASARELQEDADANWTLRATAEQLLPYFERAGYVGGINPARATADFNYQDYYTILRNAVTNGTSVDFSTLRDIQEKVYAGTFKTKGGTTLKYTDPRPGSGKTGALAATELPLTFTSDNLVNMTDGYYRIVAFSQRPLDIDGKDLAGDKSNIQGIVGPRYISGYRFNSEKTDPDDTNNYGGRWLHFLETDMSHSTIHTYADLLAKISEVDTQKGGTSDRDQISHPAMKGNIEILPADFDPSSIFKFTGTTAANDYKVYNIGTQGLQLWARPGGTEGLTDAHKFGRTELVESAPSSAEEYSAEEPRGWSKQFRLADIGGGAVTLSTFKQNTGNWDTDVVENLKTNYVCIDRNHRYRITCHENNEMVEIGEHHDTDGSVNGIQDTKWCLQPVGIHEEWPYNEMPLRVEVQKGGVKNRDLTGGDLTAESNKDTNYYGTLYVPFDTRLGNTTDAAFTLTKDPTEWGTTTTPNRVTMSSVSRLNEMGNPQFVPANWPVVIRSGNPGTASLKNQDDTDYATRHYVNMYIPNVTPTVISTAASEIKLKGQYLEQTLTSTELGAEPDTKTIMVFGLPFKGGKSHTDSHDYNEDEQVGWFTNDNWARESHSGYKAHTDSYAAATASPGTVALDTQRSNKYVYHNKVYYVLNSSYSGSAPSKFNVAIFDDEGDWDEEDDKPIKESVGNKNVPWPCRVYDLQGRRIAEHESPETLLINHPSLEPGVYIFGDRKVIVK